MRQPLVGRQSATLALGGAVQRLVELARVRAVGQRRGDAGILEIGFGRGDQLGLRDGLKGAVEAVAGHQPPPLLELARPVGQAAAEIQPARRLQPAVALDAMPVEDGLNVAQEAHRAGRPRAAE